MSDKKVISLTRARKSRARVDKAARAAENAVKFGRTKSEKELEKARAEKAERDLDGLERDT